MRSPTLEELLARPEIPAEEKILYWMREAKEAKYLLSQLENAATSAVDAYESRFGSIMGQYLGPIDSEMKVLHQLLGKLNDSGRY